ncbi:MAG: hypothetical protein ABI298_02785 [Acidimicrobiales bacterium]
MPTEYVGAFGTVVVVVDVAIVDVVDVVVGVVVEVVVEIVVEVVVVPAVAVEVAAPKTNTMTVTAANEYSPSPSRRSKTAPCV